MNNDKKKQTPEPNRKPGVFPGEQPAQKPRKPEADDRAGASKGQPGQPQKR